MYAKRVDANQPEIVKEFRRLGASVFVVNRDFDLIVGFNELNYLVEVKDGSKPPSGRKLTPNEVKFWKGWKGQICEIKSIEEVYFLLFPLKIA